MKEREAALLIRSGVVERAVIYREWSPLIGDTSTPGPWVVWLHGEEMPAEVRNRVELARGGVRTWSSLDSAYDWVSRACGDRRNVAVSIEEGWPVARPLEAEA